MLHWQGWYIGSVPIYTFEKEGTDGEERGGEQRETEGQRNLVVIRQQVLY